uniref:Uncharacterized protein n=1 Tax=Rhizophora mucronata TaxID=61149 RepID=A0A2P2NVI7_RHIMU
MLVCACACANPEQKQRNDKMDTFLNQSIIASKSLQEDIAALKNPKHIT